MADPTAPSRQIGLTLGAVGLTSTIGQLLLMRELIPISGGNELVLSLILAVWLACVALGAWLPIEYGRGQAPRAGTSPTPTAGARRLAAGLGLVTIVLPAQVALVRAGHRLLGITPGALLPLGPMLWTILLAVGPLCLLLGRQFARAAQLYGAAAYAAESGGAVVGGVLFSFLLVRWLNPFQIALLVGAANLAVAARLAWSNSRAPAVLLAAGAAVALIAALPLGRRLDRATLGWQYAGLRFARDSVYGRIVVTGSDEQRVFWENGLLFFETQGTAAEEIAHLPLLAHPAPRRTLIIGGGVRGTVAEALRHPSIESVEYVELDPLLVVAARSQLPPSQAAALDDPRVTVIHLDGRTYVRQLGQQEQRRFDVIVLDLPEPATGQINRFYTQEFFAEVRAILAPGGILAMGVPWQENYVHPPLQRLAASLRRTVAAEFPEIALVPGERLFLLASDTPLPHDPDTFVGRLAKRGIATRWVVPSALAYWLNADRLAQAEAVLGAASTARVNHDLAPISYFYGLTVWLSRFYRGLDRLDARPWQLACLAVPLLALLIVHFRRPLRASQSVPTAIGLIGFGQMALEVALLLALQAVHGYVYGQVGWIVTAFMAGLALGAAVMARRAWLSPLSRGRAGPRWRSGAGLARAQAGLALLAVLFPAMVTLRPPLWAFALLAFLAGALGGGAFPAAVACLTAEGEGAGRSTASLYGADLAGACLGALLAGTLLVPILGVGGTCLAVALVGLGGAWLVLPRSQRR